MQVYKWVGPHVHHAVQVQGLAQNPRATLSVLVLAYHPRWIHRWIHAPTARVHAFYVRMAVVGMDTTIAER